MYGVKYYADDFMIDFFESYEDAVRALYIMESIEKEQKKSEYAPDLYDVVELSYSVLRSTAKVKDAMDLYKGTTVGKCRYHKVVFESKSIEDTIDYFNKCRSEVEQIEDGYKFTEYYVTLDYLYHSKESDRTDYSVIVRQEDGDYTKDSFFDNYRMAKLHIAKQSNEEYKKTLHIIL